MFRVAIIGAGNIAKTVHIPAYQENANFKVVAIADINENLLKDTANKFGISKMYNDYQLMIDEVKPEIVSICTPNMFHKEQAIYALSHGAHVFCEKPPAIHYSELLDMQKASVLSNKLLGFNLHHRYRNDVQLLKKWIEENDHNLIYYVEISALRRKGVPSWGSFTNKKLSGGGPLIDYGVHMLDLVLYILNYPSVNYVSASMSDFIGKAGGEGDFGQWDGKLFDVEDSLFGQIVFKNQLSIHIKTAYTFHMKDSQDLNLKLYSKDYAYLLVPPSKFAYNQMIEHRDSDQIDRLAAIKNFINKINGNDNDIIDFDKVKLTQQIVDALYQSANSGKPIVFGDYDV